MTRRLFTLLLLAVFGFGLLAGPHPCEPSHEERPGEEESAQPSCHAAAPAAESIEVRADASPADEDQSCCDTLCQHACHMAAVAEASSVPIAIAPVSQAVAETSVSGSLLFAHPIEHIPLV